MASIYGRRTRSGQMRYQAIIRRKGHPALRQTFPNKTLAKEWAKTIEARIVAGRFLPRIDAERHTLAEAVDRYLGESLTALSPRSQQIRRSQVLWWKERLGEYALAAVTPGVVAEARAELLNRVSGPTGNRYLAALSAVLDRAEKEWEWIELNPVGRVRRSPEPGSSPLSGARRISFLSPASEKAGQSSTTWATVRRS